MFTQKEQQEIINKRHQVVVAYCKKKGWDYNPENLSIEQIMEIRSQKEWKEVPQLIIGKI